MNGKRMIAFFSAFCILMTALYLRIGLLISDRSYAQTAKEQSSFSLSVPSGRGMIYDCSLRPLAENSLSVRAAVLLTGRNFELICRHAEGLSREFLARQKASGKPFLCTLDTCLISDPNIHLFPAELREEASGSVRHILGYCRNGTGVSGVEKAFESVLHRPPRKITYHLDGLGRGFADRNPEITRQESPSSDVVLTLDRDIQTICETVGRKTLRKGAVVVMECSTGKIRGMCSFPDFRLEELETAVKDTARSPFLNRALCPFNVGSAFKVVTAAAALSGGADPGQKFTCTGSVKVNGTLFHCHDRRGHGTLTLKEALMASCNPYFISLGMQIPPEDFLRTARDFSFGKSFELAPGLFSSGGTLPTSEQLSAPGQLANLSFGQGYLLASPIQTALMFSSAANGGFTPNPILVEGILKNGRITSRTEPSGVRAVSPGTAKVLRDCLTACVMEKEHQKSTPQTTSAAGKSATAQTGIFTESGEELCSGWFGGFFPADRPRYTIVVLAEQGGEGSLAAAPAFRQIADSIHLLGPELP